jgi:hypothetical protein
MTQDWNQAIDLDFDLDADVLLAQIEEESKMAVECVESKYTTSSFQNDNGEMSISNRWVLEYQRLDRDLGDMRFRSTHTLPNKDQQVTNREGRSYARNINAFRRLNIKGSRPSDFQGVRVWVKEQVDSPGTRFEKKWWMPMAIYKEGETYEEAVGESRVATATDINPPSSPEPVESGISQEDIDLFISTVDGKAHREALQSIQQNEQLASNGELMAGVHDGALFDQLSDQGLLSEGVWTKV